MESIKTSKKFQSVLPKPKKFQSILPKPKWLRVKLPTGKKYTDLRSLVDKYKLNTDEEG